jgi:sec-independent protein translocase protein TatA
MFNGLLQPMHLILILVIALVIFGPGKLGSIGGELGKSIKNFKKAMQENDEAQPTPDPKKLDDKEK